MFAADIVDGVIMKTARVWFVSLAAVLVVAGCSSDDASSGPASGSDAPSFGEPAEPASADRVVEIEADDDFTFAPDTLEVQEGEAITFSVTNMGDIQHDFTLGPEDVQEEHEAEMADMGDMGDMDEAEHGGDPNAISVPAGETVELTWRFTEPGEVLIGCHVEGHWDAGMRARIDVV